MPGDLSKGRMDFKIKIISSDDKTGEHTLELVPDPDRYEWKEIGGKRYLYDKLDNTCISEQILIESFKKVKGLPIYCQPQEIPNAIAYIESRRACIANMLEGYKHAHTFKDKSQAFLRSLATNKLEFVILSIDIVGSTRLATSMKAEDYALLISTAFYELSEVIPKFHGHVLNYGGDALIAYFAEPGFITKNDLAIDCALTLRGLIYDALNPALRKRGFPTVDVRIGLDAGEAQVTLMGSPATKQYKDIIGEVVNLASKIQALAKPGEIYLGDMVERNLHTVRRKCCEPVNLEKSWEYKYSNGNLYKVHRVKTV